MNVDPSAAFTIALPTRRATTRLAQAIARHLEASDLVLLDGGLGAGKTFLVRALLRAIGVREAVPVPSPTFALMNEYDATLGARRDVVHADLYRLLGGDVDDAIAELGLRARRVDGWALVVEWGGDFDGPLGGDALHVVLATSPRTASISATGPRSAQVVAALEQEVAVATSF